MRAASFTVVFLSLSASIVGQSVCRTTEKPTSRAPSGFQDLWRDVAVDSRRDQSNSSHTGLPKTEPCDRVLVFQISRFRTSAAREHETARD